MSIAVIFNFCSREILFFSKSITERTIATYYVGKNYLIVKYTGKDDNQNIYNQPGMDMRNKNGYELSCIISLAVPGNMCSIPIQGTGG